MSLRTTFQRLYAQAEIAGEASASLAHGATIRVRVRGRRRQVIVGRQAAPVGVVEAQTFEAHGRIPDAAVVVCYFPTRDGWYRVVWTWDEPEPPAPLVLPEAELPADLRPVLSWRQTRRRPVPQRRIKEGTGRLWSGTGVGYHTLYRPSRSGPCRRCGTHWRSAEMPRERRDRRGISQRGAGR